MQQYPHANDFRRYLFRSAPPVETDLDREILLTQHLAYAEQHKNLAIILMLVSSGVVAMTYALIGSTNVHIWFIMNFSMGLWIFADWFRKRKRAKPTQVRGKFLARCERFSYVVGAFWASYPFFVGLDSTTAMLIAAIVTPPMISGLSALLPLNPRIVAPFAFGGAVVSFAYAALVNSVGSWTLFALLLVFLTSMFHGAKGAFRTYAAGVIAKRHAEDSYQIMSDALDASGQAFAIQDAGGNVKHANSMYTTHFSNVRREGVADSNHLVSEGGRVWQFGEYKTVADGKVFVYTDVSQLHRAMEVSKSHQQEAEHASLAQTRFLNAMKSTLRRPLDTIVACSTIAGTESEIALTPAKLREYADESLANALELRHSIDEILEYAVEDVATKNDIFVEGRALFESVDEAISAVGSRLSAAAVARINVQPIDRTLIHYFEPDALERILSHLLENAITETSGQVFLKVGKVGEKTAIVVRGNTLRAGSQQPDDDPNASNHESRERNRYAIARAGLGLPNSRRLAKRNGAEIVVQTTENGASVAAVLMPEGLVAKEVPVAKAVQQ